MRPLRIGIVGTGFARSTQVPAFHALPGVRVTAIASGRLERAQAAARELGIEHVCEEWQSLVARDDVDLVSIVAPPALHAPICLAAFQAGKAVLCEKPTALDAAEAERMWSAARAGGQLAVLDHELRFLPARRAMQEALRAGKLGKVRHVRFLYKADSRAIPTRPWDWWSDAAQGGGVLGAIGSHAVDSLRWLLGSEPESLVGMLTTHVAERSGKPVTSDDEALVLLRWPGGITGEISLSVVSSGEFGHSIELSGEHGALRAEGTKLWFAALASGKWEPVETAPLLDLAPGMPDTEWSHGFLFLARALTDAWQRGDSALPLAATFEDGWKNQRVLDAVRRSSTAGNWVAP